ncbi:diguanylate cyclase [Parvibaculum lavamentivorans DS-1]|uniref:diguanylate cyclase n=1 Tax=Parvibaculum lavamentivorans (strain DS-1 / DSM 13023 / NCIMB 13966) TaxID=402881 RepID=A7HY76_PARL1|nr:GGDEF domain-containing protein [Parvibaculum lavamentivorans]ABS64859.1 diguanylate cyclase [Parvibaculum lavamentivorans DS-1]
MQSEDLEFASEWSATALQLMAAHGIPPSPENYSIWFRYVSGKLPELNKEIDACIESGHTIDIEVTAALQDRFFSDGKLADVTLSTGAKLNTEVNQILKIIEETVGNSTALGTTVREASEGLTNQSTPNDVRRAVEAIVTASRKMEDRSVELEEHLQATKKELDELQQNLEKAHTEARTDGLTGVNNRKAFDEALARAMAAASTSNAPLCLAIGDIDHFKKFNDTFGHRTGDQVLRLVANCLKTGALEQHFVARYGGEEFAVIMPATDIATAEAISNKIRETVQARELVKRSTGESLGRVTMSMGIALLRDTDSAASLIERADGCLYDAKHAGRNRIITECHGLEMSHAKAS